MHRGGVMRGGGDRALVADVRACRPPGTVQGTSTGGAPGVLLALARLLGGALGRQRRGRGSVPRAASGWRPDGVRFSRPLCARSFWSRRSASGPGRARERAGALPYTHSTVPWVGAGRPGQHDSERGVDPSTNTAVVVLVDYPLIVLSN